MAFSSTEMQFKDIDRFFERGVFEARTGEKCNEWGFTT